MPIAGVLGHGRGRTDVDQRQLPSFSDRTNSATARHHFGRARRCTIMLVGAGALAAATGCSFAMDIAPSDPSRRTVEAARECTSSVAAPIADSISAAVGAYNTGVSLAATDEVRIYGITAKRSTGLALGVTQLAAFGIAATYGFIQASRCHSLRAERHLDEPTPKPPPTGGHGSPAANSPSTAESSSASDATLAPELPSWSAFRRVELPPPSQKTQQPSRFGSPSP